MRRFAWMANISLGAAVEHPVKETVSLPFSLSLSPPPFSPFFPLLSLRPA